MTYGLAQVMRQLKCASRLFVSTTLVENKSLGPGNKLFGFSWTREQHGLRMSSFVSTGYLATSLAQAFRSVTAVVARHPFQRSYLK